MPPRRSEVEGGGARPTVRRLVLMGVSGAGKSLMGERLAGALGVDFVEGDALHPANNVARMAAGIPLDDADRAGWLATIAERLANARGEGVGLVVACSALKRKYRDVLRGADPSVTFVFLEGERGLIAERLTRRRGHFMPLALLDSQFEALEPPDADERAITVDVVHTPDAILAAVLLHLAMDTPRPAA